MIPSSYQVFAMKLCHLHFDFTAIYSDLCDYILAVIWLLNIGQRGCGCGCGFYFLPFKRRPHRRILFAWIMAINFFYTGVWLILAIDIEFILHVVNEVRVLLLSNCSYCSDCFTRAYMIKINESCFLHNYSGSTVKTPVAPTTNLHDYSGLFSIPSDYTFVFP